MNHGDTSQGPAWSPDDQVSHWLGSDEQSASAASDEAATPNTNADDLSPDTPDLRPTAPVPPAQPWAHNVAVEHSPPTAAGPLWSGAAADAGPTAAPSLRQRLSSGGSAVRGRTVVLLVVLVAVVVLGIGAGIAALASLSGDDDAAAIDIPASSALPPPATEANTDCPSTTDGAITLGRDAGGPTGGPEVIKAFEHSYYVERSGLKAREFVTETARVGTAEQMQASISRMDPQTLHCVKITDRGKGVWGVELTEIPPGGGEPVVIRQIIQTADVEGRTFITAISKDTEQ